MTSRSWIDRLLGREVEEAAAAYIAAMRPSDQIEAGLSEALEAIAAERRRARFATPPVLPRQVRIPSIPEDI